MASEGPSPWHCYGSATLSRRRPWSCRSRGAPGPATGPARRLPRRVWGRSKGRGCLAERPLPRHGHKPAIPYLLPHGPVRHPGALSDCAHRNTVRVIGRFRRMSNWPFSKNYAQRKALCVVHRRHMAAAVVNPPAAGALGLAIIDLAQSNGVLVKTTQVVNAGTARVRIFDMVNRFLHHPGATTWSSRASCSSARYRAWTSGPRRS